jgi:hypothetical protein
LLLSVPAVNAVDFRLQDFDFFVSQDDEWRAWFLLHSISLVDAVDFRLQDVPSATPRSSQISHRKMLLVLGELTAWRKVIIDNCRRLNSGELLLELVQAGQFKQWASVTTAPVLGGVMTAEESREIDEFFLCEKKVY